MVVASVQFVELTVDVLRNGDSVHCAASGISSAVSVNLGQVDGSDRLYLMEVVIVHDFHVFTGEITTHESLGVLGVPWGTVEAGHILGIDEERVVARWLGLVTTLKFNSIDQRLNNICGCFDVEGLTVTEDDLVHKFNYGGGSQLVSLILSDIGLKIPLFDS